MEEIENIQHSLREIRLYISLGSNLGNRIHHLMTAMEHIGNLLGSPLDVSKFYESTPWGFRSDHTFYNCCLAGTSSSEPVTLMDELLNIEHEMGRIRSGTKFGDRIIDLDLLFMGDIIMDHPKLVLPHPAVESRRFVLLPLAEIAPDLKHPVNGLTIRELLELCPDQGVLTPVRV